MKDYINRILDKSPGWIKSLFDHNRFTAIALVAVAALVTLGGCQPKILSPISGKMVTRHVWEAEILIEQAKIKETVIALKAKTAAGDKEFEVQQLIIDQILASISGLIGNVPGPWGGIAVSALGIITTGLGADNIRKGSVIRKAKGGKRFVDSSQHLSVRHS